MSFFGMLMISSRKHAHGGGEAEEMALMGFVFAAKPTK
jgi:hypothetical protein